MAGAYAAAVFVEVPVQDIVATIFDAPVAPVGGKDALGIGLLWSSAGNAVGDFTGVGTGFFIGGLPLNNKSLSNVRKVQIIVEFGSSPDFTDFDPTVIRRIALEKIGLFAVLKVQRNVLKKTVLVSFDGEVIMGLTVPDQIVGDGALGQEGIGGNFFSLNSDGIKEGDGGFDFVGAFHLLVGDGQGTYFFWV